jgi:hypothetical protein
MGGVSPELDTLDQLQGSNMPLSVVRLVFQDDSRFASSIHEMLLCGDVCLRKKKRGDLIPPWRWRELFSDSAWLGEQSRLLLELTEQGARRVG